MSSANSSARSSTIPTGDICEPTNEGGDQPVAGREWSPFATRYSPIAISPMAITTYAQLQTAIASWLARSDLTATIADFITLFEAAANRRLRVRQMETSTNLTPSSGAATLPTDYLAWRRLTWAG